MSVHVRLEWPTEATLTSEVEERLSSYLTRYAQTLHVPVQEIAFSDNQAILVVELPPELALNQVTIPLREASARFARETLGLANFGWATAGVRADSIATSGRVDTAGKTHDDDELPAWLTNVLAQQDKGAGK